MRAFFSGLKRELNIKRSSRGPEPALAELLHGAEVPAQRSGEGRKYMIFSLDPKEFKVFGNADRVFLEKNFGIQKKLGGVGIERRLTGLRGVFLR